MKTFADLPADMQRDLMSQIRQYFGKYAEVTDRDQIQIMYPNQDYKPVHGYVVVNAAKTKYDYNEVLICDNTPDNGDALVTAVKFR